MNDKNHINFARQILKVCQLDERLAYLANLPSFIRQKHSYNNIFIQPLSHLPDMSEVAIHIFSSLDELGGNEKKTLESMEPVLKSLQQDMQNSTNYMEHYYYDRKHFFYQQILNALKDISNQFTSLSGEKQISRSLSKENEVALLLSFLSFVYFSLWLAPRQLFFPASSYCSGSWDLWEETDYFKLLEEFTPESERDFFSEICMTDTIWDERLDPFALIKAMLIRMGEKSSPPTSYSIIDRTMREFLRFLGLNEYKRADAELEFLKIYEFQQAELFKKLFRK